MTGARSRLDASVSLAAMHVPARDEVRAYRPGERLTLASARRSDGAASCARDAWTSSGASVRQALAETRASRAQSDSDGALRARDAARPCRSLPPDARSLRDARSDCLPAPEMSSLPSGRGPRSARTPNGRVGDSAAGPIGHERRGSAAGARSEDCGARAARSPSLSAPPQGDVDRASRGLHPVFLSRPRL
jgi:hypothetical protein